MKLNLVGIELFYQTLHDPADRALVDSQVPGNLNVASTSKPHLHDPGSPRAFPGKPAFQSLVPDGNLAWSRAATCHGTIHLLFDFSSPLTETVLLGNIAVRFPKERLEWDSKTLRFTNNQQANEFIRTEYRKGWESEGL